MLSMPNSGTASHFSFVRPRSRAYLHMARHSSPLVIVQLFFFFFLFLPFCCNGNKPNSAVFVVPASGMAQYRGPVFRPFVHWYVRPSVRPSVNICDHPSVESTVQVRNAETFEIL